MSNNLLQRIEQNASTYEVGEEFTTHDLLVKMGLKSQMRSLSRKMKYAKNVEKSRYNRGYTIWKRKR